MHSLDPGNFLKRVFESAAADQAIADDCVRCFSELQKAFTDQFFRRALVRNCCSHVEVRLFHMTENLLVMHEMMPTVMEWMDEADRERFDDAFDFSLSPTEVLALREEAPHIDKGSITTKPFFVGPRERFRVVSTLFARMLRTDAEISYGDEGWKSLNIMIAVRNRLVHPKSREGGSDVTDGEVLETQKAHRWALQNLNRLIARGNEISHRLVPVMERMQEEQVALLEVEMTKLADRLRARNASQ